jgi:exopolysaccharide production protein ExoZ
MIRFGRLFEIGRPGRSRPMEGLRGIAVGLVFLQHYCSQYLAYGHVTGAAYLIAETFFRIGNYGVELFFVLSGYLIYGILLRRRPTFVDFMTRRARRLYPAFLVALLIGVLIDAMRPIAKIPEGAEGLFYLAENIAFLPGLLPIAPLSSVNWSLSYEWWFYVTVTLLFSTLGVATSRKVIRVGLISTFATVLVGFSVLGFAAPIRGLPLFAGMILAETAVSIPDNIPILFVIGSMATTLTDLPAWGDELILSFSLYILCSATFYTDGWISRLLSLRYLRWFGNMSYSYYLVHGFFVLISLQTIFKFCPILREDIGFFSLLIPIFLGSICIGAILFLKVEKRYSLNVPETNRRAATA